jgi:hypothetical protein
MEVFNAELFAIKQAMQLIGQRVGQLSDRGYLNIFR